MGKWLRARKTALHRWLVDDRRIGQRVVSALAKIVHDLGNRNPGWYGSKEISAVTGSWRRLPFRALRQPIAALSRQLDFYGDQIFANQVWNPITGPAGTERKALRDRNNLAFRRGDEHLERQRPVAQPSGAQPSFSIVTPYYKHFEYFGDCANSVDRAVRLSGSVPIEWIVVNDDPSMSPDKLRSVIPGALQDRTRLISNSTNIGNTATLNVGIDVSRFEWILFLDCDDAISQRAPHVLAKYIEAYPQCRYFSSSMVDIDHDGRILRYRIRESKATQLFTEGNTASHLKAIRRDAFDQLGLLDTQFDGSQDYEFALRISTGEPICFVPEFLYGYRSHARTQTLSALDEQFFRARRIQQIYLDRIWAPRSPQPDLQSDLT